MSCKLLVDPLESKEEVLRFDGKVSKAIVNASLRAGEAKPNWVKEKNKVIAHVKGTTEVRRVISDLWLEKKDRYYHFSIKTVRPNLDQAENAKKDMLLLKAHDEKIIPYFALYYNPDGNTRADYKHNFAQKIFDTEKDECFLIGEDYWEFIGGKGSYQNLLALFEQVGQLTRTQVLPKLID